MTDNNPSLLPPPRERFQFSLGGLMTAMLLCAVVAGVVQWLDIPIEAKIVLLVILAGMALYVVLRAPFVLGNLLGRGPRWDEIRRKRKELAKLAQQRKADHRSS